MTFANFRKYAVRLGALAICVAAFSASPSMAQGGGGRGMMSPEQQQAQMDAMTKAVGLTADQVAKVKAINAETMKKMMDLRSAGGDPQDMRPKMMAMRSEQQSKIKALLTDEQKPKYDAYLASMPQGRGPRPGGAEGAPPPPPQ